MAQIGIEPKHPLALFPPEPSCPLDQKVVGRYRTDDPSVSPKRPSLWVQKKRFALIEQQQRLIRTDRDPLWTKRQRAKDFSSLVLQIQNKQLTATRGSPTNQDLPLILRGKGGDQIGRLEGGKNKSLMRLGRKSASTDNGNDENARTQAETHPFE